MAELNAWRHVDCVEAGENISAARGTFAQWVSPHDSLKICGDPSRTRESLLHIPCWHITVVGMNATSIPDLISRLIAVNGGNAQQAAARLGTSAASLSRWRSGNARPRKHLEDRLRAIVDGSGDLVALAERTHEDARLVRLEEAISGTIHALREEFHRTASVSTRQEVLDLVAALFFAHVTSIDSGARGIGDHLRAKKETAAHALNRFILDALANYLPARNGDSRSDGQLGLERFFAPLSETDEHFAGRLLKIFERDASAFRELHKAGRDDLINEVFSRFMSTSFVDEKEMGQYLTPPEITRFMVEVGFHALKPEARDRLLDLGTGCGGSIVLDPSCGVGSFLAETIRFCQASFVGIMTLARRHAGCRDSSKVELWASTSQSECCDLR